LSDFDAQDCVQNFGPTDDVAKLVQEVQLIYRPAYRIFFNMYADLKFGGLLLAQPNIMNAQYRYRYHYAAHVIN